MQDHFLFRGAKIRYQVVGKGSAVVLIHGFLGSMDLWKDQVYHLKKSFKVISLDLPGHGDSGNLGYIHSMELMADLIYSLIRKLGLRKVSLVGHSMGGYVSLAFAEKYTDHLSSLVLINSTSLTDKSNRKKSRQQLIQLLPKKREELLRTLVESFFVIDSFKRRYWVNRYLRWAQACNDQGIVAAVRGMMERKERKIVLKFAPYPYLFLSGEQDPIINLEVNREETELNANGKLKIIRESGHITPLERSGALNTILMKFLKGRAINSD